MEEEEEEEEPKEKRGPSPGGEGKTACVVVHTDGLASIYIPLHACGVSARHCSHMHQFGLEPVCTFISLL